MRSNLFRMISILVALCLTGVLGVPIALGEGVELVNAGFEEDYDEWGVPSGWHQGRYSHGMSVIGGDSFPDRLFGPLGPVEVKPNEGDQMLRLGGPVYSQNTGGDEVWQDFTVPAEDPVVRFSFKICSYDVAPNDFFTYKVTSSDEMEIWAATQRTAPGTEAGTASCTDWETGALNLAGHEGQAARLSLSVGGTVYPNRATWAYVDAVSAPTVEASVRVTPRTLRAGATEQAGSVISALLQMPEAGALETVEVGSVALGAGTKTLAPLERPVEIGDANGDGVPDMTFKFSRAEVVSALLGAGDTVAPLEVVQSVELTLSGRLDDGRAFSAQDTVELSLDQLLSAKRKK